MIARANRFVPSFEEAGRQAAEIGRHLQLTLALAALIGVTTGIGVAGFDEAVGRTLEWVKDQQLVVLCLAPVAGLMAVTLIQLVARDRDSSTTDAYVRAYHQRGGRLRIRQLWGKLGASAATLGSGGALGFEGPSLLLGGTIGSAVEERFTGKVRRDDAKVLMVAGAAAGVAAVFKAPLTGVVFALEVPYRSDLARRAMLPSLVAAGSAYVTYVILVGTNPLLSTGGSAPFDLRDLGGGLLLGVVCGILARIGAWSIRHAKKMSFPTPVRLIAAAVSLAALAPLAELWFDAPLHLGPGYEAIEFAVEGDRSLMILAALFVVRAFATWVSTAGGGVGGLFIPLVTQGAIVGAMFQQVVDVPNARLFPIVGIAAFLGAGYRTPLAGVAFVAEATGEPGFLVPALLAAATAQIAMGRRSFSPYQRGERLPDVGPLTRLPVRDIMSANPDTVDANAALDDALNTMLRWNRRWAPVVDGSSYYGLLAVQDIAAIHRDEWPDLTARQIARTNLIPASPSDSVSSVSERLRSSESDAIAVTGDDGVVIGVVTLRDLNNVEILLDKLANDTT